MMEYLDLIIFLLLLSAGYIFGQIAEKKHFKSIIHREEELRSLLIFNERFPPPGMGVPDTQLVGGNVVISIDYFKHIRCIIEFSINIYGQINETIHLSYLVWS